MRYRHIIGVGTVVSEIPVLSDTAPAVPDKERKPIGVCQSFYVRIRSRSTENDFCFQPLVQKRPDTAFQIWRFLICAYSECMTELHIAPPCRTRSVPDTTVNQFAVSRITAPAIIKPPAPAAPKRKFYFTESGKKCL